VNDGGKFGTLILNEYVELSGCSSSNFIVIVLTPKSVAQLTGLILSYVFESTFA
jgi:hypothetical protein